MICPYADNSMANPLRVVITLHAAVVTLKARS